MMNLLMANSLSCSMQQWNGHDILPTALYIWTEAELVRGNARRKYREYTDGLDILTQHQVTLSLLSYMCLVRCTLSQPNSIMKCSGAFVSLGCSGALVLSQSYHQGRVRRVSLQRPSYFLPRGRDSLAHQGLQAIWKNDRLLTTALLYHLRITRVRYRLITKLQFRSVCGTTNIVLLQV